MTRTIALLATCVATLSLLAACGGGGGGSSDPAISLFQPTVLYSNGEAQLRILGNGFGARKSKVTVRFDAPSGTPFQNGTTSSFETLCTVDSDSQVRGTAPASFASDDVEAIVTVIRTDGTEIVSDGPAATFIKQEVTGMTPNSVSSGAQPPFTITGVGFQPPLGLVNIRFTATSGTPFLAGASNFITTIGTVETNSTISGFFPDGMVSEACDASVTVILPDGATISSSGPVVHWTPIPTIASFSPSSVPSGTPVPFVMTGTAYAPTGASATITFEAVSGTPFYDGTSATWSFQGTVDDATQISGVMPPMLVDAVGLAYVRVNLSGGTEATSAAPIVQYLPPPVVSTFAPPTFQTGSANPWETAGPNVAFTIGGLYFGSPGTAVTVTFTAASGTPFNNGTSATFVADATVVSTTTITGVFADPIADAEVSGNVTVHFPTGVDVSSPPDVWSVVQNPAISLPEWTEDATTSGFIDVWNYGVDSSHDISFADGFQFPFFGTSYTDGYANTNGSITFGSSDWTYWGDTTAFVMYPRLAILMSDLEPYSGGDFIWNTTAHSDRGVLTWNESAFYYAQGTCSMQLSTFYTGRIDFCYGYISQAATSTGIVGIHKGSGGTINQVDFSSVVFDDKATIGDSTSPYEPTNYPDIRGTNPSNRTSGGWILFYPLPGGGYDWASGS